MVDTTYHLPPLLARTQLIVPVTREINVPMTHEYLSLWTLEGCILIFGLLFYVLLILQIKLITIVSAFRTDYFLNCIVLFNIRSYLSKQLLVLIKMYHLYHYYTCTRPNH